MRTWFSLSLIACLFLQFNAATSAFGAAEPHHALPHGALTNHHARVQAARKLFPHVFAGANDKLADVAAFKARYSGELQALLHKNGQFRGAIAGLKPEDIFFAVSRKSSKSGLFVRLADAEGKPHVFLISSGAGTILPEKVEASRFNLGAHGAHLDTHDKRVLVVDKSGQVRVRDRNLWERFKSLFAFFRSRSGEHQAKPFFTVNDMHLHRRADVANEKEGKFKTGWLGGSKSVIGKDGSLNRDKFMSWHRAAIGEMYAFAKMEFQAAGKALAAPDFINRASVQVGTFTDSSGQVRSIPFVTIEKDGVSLAFAVAEAKGLFPNGNRSWDFPQFLPVAHGTAIELAGGDKLIVNPGKGYEWHDGPNYASGTDNRYVYSLAPRDPVRQTTNYYYNYDSGYYNSYWFYHDLTYWDDCYYHSHYWHHHHHYYDYDYYHYDYGHYGDLTQDTTIINNDNSVHNTTINQSVDATPDLGVSSEQSSWSGGDPIAPPLEVPGSDLQADPSAMDSSMGMDWDSPSSPSSPSFDSDTSFTDSSSGSDPSY